MSYYVTAVLLVLGTMISCTTSSGAKDSADGSKNPAAASEVGQLPKQKNPRGEKPLSCVKSINEFGQPGSCQCPPGLSYNPITGRCENGGRMCTQALVEMFNEKTGQCHTARNGCEASDLKSAGWRKKAETDACKK